MGWVPILFSFRGRINRAKYWLAVLIIFVFDIVLSLLGLAIANTTLFQIFSVLVNVPIFVASFAIAIKRLHDRNRSAWWLLFFYMGPVVFIAAGLAIMWSTADGASFLLRLCLIGALALMIWGTVEIGFLRGTTGYNRFGPDPLARSS
jgi:uncharacterized membrane protein YhaH (DUF805 family)